MAFLYLMKNIMPNKPAACKIGITGFDKAKARLGQYQISYPLSDHCARFDYLWYGEADIIQRLERFLLQDTFASAIPFRGKGLTEWLDIDGEEARSSINYIINTTPFLVKQVDQTGITMYNIGTVIKNISSKKSYV